YLWFRPDQTNGRLLVYLHPEGKTREAGRGAEIEWLVNQGFTVVAPDLLGIGETGPGSFKGDSYINDTSYNQFFAALLTGRSITGIRAGDLNRLILTVRSKMKKQDGSVTVYARGTMTPAALHAAAFNDSISVLILVEPLVSYRSVAEHRIYNSDWVHSLVAGALAEYDLPDLGALVAPRRLLYLNSVDGTGDKLPAAQAEISLGVVTNSFQEANNLHNLGIESAATESAMKEVIRNWINAE
ncbi:MAG: hypothetical protein R3224_07955, partial [Balneolaceae bacterium]|nr:hypothetical protein [Balneolaceae bacterium]